MRLKTTILWTMISSLSAAALLGIIAIILPDLVGSDEEVLITTLLLGLYSLPALACSVVIGRGRLRIVMWVGVAAAPLAWMVWLPQIWANPWSWGRGWDELLVKTGFSLTFLALWAAHLGLLSMLRLNRASFHWTRLGTLALAALMVVIGTPALWAEYDEDLFNRLLAVLAILVGCGTLVTPILALLEVMQRKASHESIPMDVRVELKCPRCGAEQELQAGGARCSGCGLRIDVRIEEPRCACGYLLYHLSADQCPECGRPVTAEQAWRL